MQLPKNKLIEVDDVSFYYEDLPVLTDVSLDVYEGDFWAITGPNGGGKTTLLRIILGLLAPSSGRVSFFREGNAVSSLNMGYLPQKNLIDSHFPITVSEVIFSGLMGEKKLLRPFSEGQKERVEKMIVLMGLSGLEDRLIGQLSGGQLQRTLLGRTLVSDPEILILDEPSSYVDKSFESRMYDLFKEISASTTVLLVSHELNKVTEMANRLVMINKKIENIGDV